MTRSAMGAVGGKLGWGMVAAAMLSLSAAAQAQDDDRWRVRVGAGRIDFRDDASFRIGGQPAAGAGAKLEDNTTLLTDIGYRFTRQWSANLTLGVPPTSEVDGTGAAAPFGRLGSVKYGPLALTGQYQFDGVGGLRPYLGAGAVYYIVLDARDGAVADLEVDNAWGSVLQAGVEYQVSPAIAVFLDVKKLFLKTDARGSLPALGGAPITARVALDPTVVMVGLAFNF